MVMGTFYLVEIHRMTASQSGLEISVIFSNQDRVYVCFRYNLLNCNHMWHLIIKCKAFELNKWLCQDTNLSNGYGHFLFGKDT